MNRTRVFIGVSVVTLSVLMLELTLTRIFSATMYYHYAFMAISVALFGSGASGVFVYLIRRRITEANSAGVLSIASVLYGLSTVFALYVILNSPLTYDATEAENYMRLVRMYAATALPFFFAGSVVTVAITTFAGSISRLYVFDLAGAALGCLLLIPVLNLLGGINAVLLVAALAAAGSLIFAFGGAARNRKPVVVGTAAITGCLLTALLIYNCSTGAIDIRKAKGYDQSSLLMSKWNSFSRITVEGDLRQPQLEIKIDSDAATTITRDASKSELHQIQRSRIEALAYHLKTAGKVLIIGPGGGNDVMTARVFGMRDITAVEVNPIIARDVMSSEPVLSYSGKLMQQPDVKLVVDEGRSFIRSSHDRYDIIQATMVDTWAATAAGAFALTENNLYTVEAFKDYVNHLNDDGILTMTRWYFDPPDQLLRLVSLTRVMMSELGISNPERHIMLFVGARDAGQRAPATLIFKKSELSDEEAATLEKLGFYLLYSPHVRPDNLFTRLITAPDPAEVWSSFETNIEPSRDNNPFFFNSLRLSNFMRALKGTGEWQKTNLGTFVLFALVAITSVMVLVFIIGPLVIARRRDLAYSTRTKLSYLLYFACLGAGFIIVEVAMIQKFILFLGHPVYSLTVVLFSLLIFCALGSYLSGRVEDAQVVGTIKKLLMAIALVVGAYILILPPIFYGLVHLPQPVRIALAVLLLAPIAVLMGMPMPLGIRILKSRVPEIIPWAWGVNGATSVMGSVAALAIALLTGFNQALVVGALVYLVAIVFIARQVPHPQKQKGEVDVEQVVASKQRA